METSEDALLGGRLRLRQPLRGHRAGTDAVLLAAAADPRPGDLVCDFGAASGAVGLMIAVRHEVRVVLAERDPALVALARDNIALNGFEGRVSAVEVDLEATASVRRAAGLPPRSAALVVANPPYLERGAVRPSPDAGKRAAHLIDGTLADWARAAADLLASRGTFLMIHRADRTESCLTALEGRFGSFALRFVHPHAVSLASRVVIRARLGGGGPTEIHPPLVLHTEGGGFTPEVARLHEGKGALFAAAP